MVERIQGFYTVVCPQVRPRAEAWDPERWSRRVSWRSLAGCATICPSSRIIGFPPRRSGVPVTLRPSPLPSFRQEMAQTARFAAPLVGGQLAGVGMNFVDTVMAGRLGSVTLGAVAVGSSSVAAILLFMTGVLMVVQATVAHLEGANRRAEMAAYLHQAAYVSLFLAGGGGLLMWNFRPVLEALAVQPELVFDAAGYLRMLTWGLPGLALYLVLRFFCEGVGHSRPTLAIGVLGLLVNIPANALLMFGGLGIPAMGARGCGLATSVVWWSQCVAMAVYVARASHLRDVDVLRGASAPRLAEMREIVRIGLPIGGAIFLEASMFSVAALIVGSIGTLEMAGHQVALNFAALTFMVPLGIAMATTVRVGNADGRGDREAVLRVAGAGFALTLICQVVSATLMVTVPGWIATIYTSEPGVVAIAVQLLAFAALFQLSDGLQVSAAGALRGLRDTRIPMLLTLVAYWGVGIPLGYWLAIVRGAGPSGLWLGMTAGLTAAGVLLSARFRRITRVRVDHVSSVR